MARPQLQTWLLLTPAALVIGILFIGGLSLALIQSLGYFPPLDEHAFTLRHYTHLFLDREIWQSLVLTVELSVVATAVSAISGVGIAIALRDLASRSAGVALLMQMPVAIPHLAIGVVVISLLAPSGLIARSIYSIGLIQAPADFPVLINDRFGMGIVIAYVLKEAPFIALMSYAVLVRIGREYEQVARTLGASWFQRLRYVVLPLLAPATLSSSLLVLAFTFGAFEMPFLLGRSYPTMLSVVAQRRFMSVNLDERPSAIALAIVLAAAASLLVWAYARIAGLVFEGEKPLIF